MKFKDNFGNVWKTRTAAIVSNGIYYGAVTIGGTAFISGISMCYGSAYLIRVLGGIENEILRQKR